MTVKADMLKLLNSTQFPKNTGRTNNLKPGQTFSLSMVLGKVRMFYGKGLPSRGSTRSTQSCWQWLRSC